MSAAATSTEAGAGQATVVTPEELAIMVVLAREGRKWSQEQLAAVADVSVRTIQRVEMGAPSSFDTRRALARAFAMEDIDGFNKPFVRITAEEMRARQEKFNREHITLVVSPMESGRAFAGLAEMTELDFFHAAFDMEREAAEEFAALTDLFREFRDCHDLYSEVDKLDIHEDFQGRINRLLAQQVSLRFAERSVLVGAMDERARRLPMKVAYILAFPKGKEPTEIATAREMKIGV